MTPQQLLILGRIVERSATWALAALLLFFAYKLAIMRRSQPSQTAELKWNDILLKLSRISPGVFFAILGTGVLIANLRSPLELSFRNQTTQADSSSENASADFSARYAQDISAPRIVDICVAINRVDLFANMLDGKNDSKSIDELKSASEKLMGYRDDLLGIAFGKNQILEFQRNLKDPKSVPSNKAPTFEALQRAYNSTEMTP